jgi:hypothetical protein
VLAALLCLLFEYSSILCYMCVCVCNAVQYNVAHLLYRDPSFRTVASDVATTVSKKTHSFLIYIQANVESSPTPCITSRPMQFAAS